MALFWDRLVTILEHDPANEKVSLEFVDEGGRTRTFTVWDGPFVRPVLPDLVLDYMAVLTRPRHASPQFRALEAETWFADPQVGDCFKQGSRLFITIHAIGAAGEITCVKTVYNYDDSLSLEDHEVLIFKNAEELRCTYQYKERPGYCLVAHSTNRSYSRIKAPENSPVPRGDSPLLRTEIGIDKESPVT